MQMLCGKSTARSWVGRSALARLSLATAFGKSSSCLPLLTHPRRATPLLHARHYATGKLDLPSLDLKWRRSWASAETKPYAPGTESQFVLPMFPYPSGYLHLGHLRVYTIADVIARFRRLQGYDAVLPMGWDAFGLPAENAALARGFPPARWTADNIRRMKDQLEHMNGSWDWKRELTTCDPKFYKHTQNIFLMLHERGLAYQAEAEVNYDPVDKTVVANEQVDSNGFCWRSGAKVEKRKLKQWFLRISEFQEDLLKGLDTLAKDGAWPERVLSMQRNWLGKSTGAMVKFPVMAMGHDVHSSIEVYTTRLDTLPGVQYLALSSSHPIVSKLAQVDAELQAFLDTLPGLPPDSKVGYLLPHLRAVNPLAYHEDSPDATKKSIPVYVAPYVIDGYGEGAVMGVPAHDHRDHAFWKTHRSDEPVRVVLSASEDESTTVILNEPFVGHGIMTADSGPFKGKSSVEVGQMLIDLLEPAQLAKPVERWRLRDWLISRQRYWGTPIPIVHCDSCGPVPVPEDQLPVELPMVDNHWFEGKPGNPLEHAAEWINTKCPKCDGPGKRDTDTMDTFVDSSWYYARFADPHNENQPFSKEAADKYLPVNLYIGGIEHAILHLLYARFIYKFLRTTPLLADGQDSEVTAEPFTRLIAQGMVHGKTYSDPETGRFLTPDELDLSDPQQPKIRSTGVVAATSYEKMSKSKHNGVDPTGIIAKYGADATRAHMLFQAPVGEILNWDEAKISGVTRWLSRLHNHVGSLAQKKDGMDESAKSSLETRFSKLDSMTSDELAQWDVDAKVWREVQGTIASVTSSYSGVYGLNTVVSDLMGLTNVLLEHEASPVLLQEATSALIRMLAPITPAFAEECWSILHPSTPSIFSAASFPTVDGTLPILQPRLRTCAVQVKGKLRAVVEVPPPPGSLEGDVLRDWMVEEILKTEEGGRLGGAVDLKGARRVIVVRGGSAVNFVI
ncbi:related to leucine--tRNA ligase precursor, mitochondrial [Cephalotrichum gorgonifer]|uniref:leucine--tRNA ligase n=1 Tax=Cephalotrichum gorgonifer TaxID=2041049 RepID=A0AAE8STJ0_9PEZI|nr:related to leucine--tRNA ligase precursor, mitochondrial [Cephalotrichum gorgonifer]